MEMYGQRKGVTVIDCSKVQLDMSTVLVGKVMRQCGISVIAYFQNTAGQDPEQPEVRSDIRKELYQLTSKGPFQPALF